MQPDQRENQKRGSKSISMIRVVCLISDTVPHDSETKQQAGQASGSEPGSADSKTNEKKGDDISDVDFEEVKDDDKK